MGRKPEIFLLLGVRRVEEVGRGGVKVKVRVKEVEVHTSSQSLTKEPEV